MLLRRQRRALMDEQIPHGHVGVAQVCAECIFTKEIIENAPRRMPTEECAALMPRAVKLRIAILYIFLQIAEEWRQEIFLIGSRRALDLSFIEIMIRLCEIQHPVHLRQHLIRQSAVLRLDQDHRDFESGNIFRQHRFIEIRHHHRCHVSEVRVRHAHRRASFQDAEYFHCLFGICDF